MKHLNTSAAVRKNNMKTKHIWNMKGIQPWDRCTTMSCRQTGNTWHHQQQADMTNMKNKPTAGRHETHEKTINSRQTIVIWRHASMQKWDIWKNNSRQPWEIWENNSICAGNRNTSQSRQADITHMKHKQLADRRNIRKHTSRQDI